jgi:hypothetical protein
MNIDLEGIRIPAALSPFEPRLLLGNRDRQNHTKEQNSHYASPRQGPTGYSASTTG